MKSIVIPLFILFGTYASILTRVPRHEYMDTLQSCLVDHGMKNYYKYPKIKNDPSIYYTMLNFSIQNLRFAGPMVPKPAAIILPATKEEVINSVLCCKKGSFEIRVRCGGHSYEGSSYVSTDGSDFVVIDLMNLDRVSVDMATKTAWVEGGATLGQVYYSIAEASRVHGFSAGSCPTVGAGGHIAGGGFGLLSRKYGLAADNVVDALLVDANGALLDRASMGEEVFWAIRGGGGGVWGVVYAWKIQLQDVPGTVTGFVVNRMGSGHVATLVNKWQYAAPKLPDEFYLSAFVGAGLPESGQRLGISATFKGFYLGNKSEAVGILHEAFPELGIDEESCKEMTWIESILYFSGLKNGTPIAGLKDRFLHDKKYFKAKSDYVRKPMSEQGIASLITGLKKEPKGYVILDPYGGKMERMSSVAIAFPHRKGNLFSVQYMVEWREYEDARRGEYMEWIRGLYGEMEGHVSADPRAAYVNYVDYDLGVTVTVTTMVAGDNVATARAWGEKYFLGNYERLVRAKTVIDPMNVFRNQQGIPPMEGVDRWDVM